MVKRIITSLVLIIFYCSYALGGGEADVLPPATTSTFHNCSPYNDVIMMEADWEKMKKMAELTHKREATIAHMKSVIEALSPELQSSMHATARLLASDVIEYNSHGPILPAAYGWWAYVPDASTEKSVLVELSDLLLPFASETSVDFNQQPADKSPTS